MKKQIIVLCALFAAGSANCSMFSRLKQSAQDKLQQAKDSLQGAAVSIKGKLKSISTTVKNNLRGGMKRFQDKVNEIKAKMQGNYAKEQAALQRQLIKDYYDALPQTTQIWCNGLEGKLERGIPLTFDEWVRLDNEIRDAINNTDLG